MMVNHAYLVKLAHASSYEACVDASKEEVSSLFLGRLLDFLIESGRSRDADDLCCALGHGWEYVAPSATPGDPRGDLFKLEHRLKA